MQLSARNQLKGKVTGVDLGAVMANIKIEVSEPNTITAVITKESAEKLGLFFGLHGLTNVSPPNVEYSHSNSFMNSIREKSSVSVKAFLVCSASFTSSTNLPLMSCLP